MQVAGGRAGAVAARHVGTPGRRCAHAVSVRRRAPLPRLVARASQSEQTQADRPQPGEPHTDGAGALPHTETAEDHTGGVAAHPQRTAGDGEGGGSPPTGAPKQQHETGENGGAAHGSGSGRDGDAQQHGVAPQASQQPHSDGVGGGGHSDPHAPGLFARVTKQLSKHEWTAKERAHLTKKFKELKIDDEEHLRSYVARAPARLAASTASNSQ